MKIGITYEVCKADDERVKKFNDFTDIETINSIKAALEATDNTVTLMGDAEQLMRHLLNGTLDCDIVLNLTGGISSQNRGISIPALLDAYKIPYVGSDAFGLSLASNKYLTRLIAQSHGIKTPKSVLFSYPNTEDIRVKLSELKYPYRIQPNYAVTNHEAVVCYDPESAAKKVEELLEQYQNDILCEEYQLSIDLAVPFIDTKSIPLWDITSIEDKPDARIGRIGKNGVYYWDLRADNDMKAIVKNSMDILYKHLGCRDLCRYDFRMTSYGEVLFLGVNPMPAVLPGSAYEAVGKKYGYRYDEMLHLVLEAACERVKLPYTKI